MKRWYWCLHCKRCFSIDIPDEKKDDAVPDKCTYLGCDGAGDALWEWEKIRKQVKESFMVEYPDVPEYNKTYLLTITETDIKKEFPLSAKQNSAFGIKPMAQEVAPDKTKQQGIDPLRLVLYLILLLLQIILLCLLLYY